MDPVRAKSFYARPSWDEAAWTEIISVEYQRLVETYPFAQRLGSLGDGRLRLLDVGCGTGIFPQHLDPWLPSGLRLECDLLDRSPLSLRQARQTLAGLDRFEVGRTFQAAIEAIPTVLAPDTRPYAVIWAIHSFTTVDRRRMADVIRHLLDRLEPTGVLFIYQLTSASSYQVLHDFYRRHHPQVGDRFMEYEDTRAILQALQVPYDLLELRCDHLVPADQPDRLANYLSKCVLDDKLDPLPFFAPLLPRYLDPDGQRYRFPQRVNFLTIPKPPAGG